MADRKMAIEAKLRRTYGASPEAREKIAVANKGFTDWRARCRKCGAELEGSLAELKGHTCG